MYNDFRIDSDIIDSLNESLNGIDTSMNDIMQTCGSSFSALSQIPGFDSAISEIKNQLGEVTSEVSNIKGSVRQQAAEVFDLDIGIAKIAEQIEIPTDFEATDSIAVNYYQTNALKKKDGKSVNEGNAAEASSLEDINGEKTGLTNIYGDHTQLQEYDATSAVSRENAFQNISGNQTEKQDYDATSAVSKESAFQNISGNETQAQEYDERSSVSKESAFQNISGNETQAQEYDANTSINNQNLSSMNVNQTTNFQKTIDENMNYSNINGATTLVSSKENVKRDETKESSAIGLGLGAAAAGLGIAASMIEKNKEDKEKEDKEKEETQENKEEA